MTSSVSQHWASNRPQNHPRVPDWLAKPLSKRQSTMQRSEEHTSELQSHLNLVCRLLLEKKKNKTDCKPYIPPTVHPPTLIGNTSERCARDDSRTRDSRSCGPIAMSTLTLLPHSLTATTV